MLQAFFIFVLLIGGFSVGYKYSTFEPSSNLAKSNPTKAEASSSQDVQYTEPRRLGWEEAARYSLNVSLLQKPDPKPRRLGSWFMIFQTMLGPAQAALLAFAIRRRFMR